MDKTETLKACPFCANETDDRGYGVLVCETRAGGHHWWEVQCQQCEASGPAKDTEAEAITAWNERTPLRDNALADDEIDAVLKEFNCGLVYEPDDKNPRGYVAFYRPREAMRKALTALRPTPPEADLRAENEALREVVRRLGRAALTTPSCKTCCQIEQDARAALTKGADHG